MVPAYATLPERLAQLVQSHRFRILLIALLALLIRLHLLGAQSLWRDEIASVAFAHLPLSQLWSAWMVHETNPPLYYTLLHVWIWLFGDSEFAVRSLSALFGTAAVVCAGVLGRKLKSERAGEIAALLVAVSALQIYYSQEARGYMLAAMAALLSLIAIAELVTRLKTAARPRTGFNEYGVWLLYVAATTTALYAHTTMAFLPLITSVYMAWLWIARGGRDVRFAGLWIGANLLCVLLWSWWGWITAQQLASSHPNIAWLAYPTNAVLLRTAEHFYGLRRSGLTLMTLSAATGLFLCTAAVAGTARIRHPAKWLLAGIAFAGPLALLLVSLYRPVFIERTIFWAQSAFLILAAAGLSTIPHRTARLGITTVLAVVLLADAIDSQRVPVKQPWREAVSVIKRGWHDGDVVLVSSAEIGVNVEYYCRRLACAFPILAIRTRTDGENWGPALFRGRIVDRNRLAGEIRRYRRVWVPAEPIYAPKPDLQPIAFQRFVVRLPFIGFETPNELAVSNWTPLPLLDNSR